MKKVLCGCLLQFILAAQDPLLYVLPPDTVILEKQPIPASVKVNRALVLWMTRSSGVTDSEFIPQGLPSADSESKAYSCPDESRGHFYRGPARVSLIDTSRNRVINTVEIRTMLSDEFELPFSIRPNFLYDVPNPLSFGEGKPNILKLHDLNGDDAALEFAIYDKPSCPSVETSIFGYSLRKDRVINYPFALKEIEKDKATSKSIFWIDTFLGPRPAKDGIRKPASNRHWMYQLSYNSGVDVFFDIYYDESKEEYFGTVRSVEHK